MTDPRSRFKARKRSKGGPRTIPDFVRDDSREVRNKLPPFGSERMRFRFDMVDFNDWCMHDMTKDQHKLVLKRLQHIENETLDQARRNGDIGEYQIDELHAKNRSAYAKYLRIVDDAETLCKVVIGNSRSERIFGYREGSIIHIIWFDPNHDIWPEGKRVR